MIKILSTVGIILTALALATGYTLAGFWPVSIFALLAGSLWLIALWRGWNRVTSLSIIIFVGVAAWGTWLGITAGWLLFGIIATLIAWDLGDFAQRFRQTEHRQNYATLQRIHLLQLAIVAGLGLLLGGIALSFELRLNMWWGILLGVLVIAGLSQAIGRLRRESD
jgi:hypothetical protein